ncbi:MAG TPA: glutamate-cysteine ligase family protein [Acidobacteriota bacterium]|jgi:CBS domain-containing protein/gamma-glutamyl:cysteine ligase YbdK (ATP-grasp superfamily)
MGEHNVNYDLNGGREAEFMRSLLNDVCALEKMLEGDCLETNVRRIGAEQELFLVDQLMKPAPIAASILKNMNDSRFTTELAKFNLEINLTPWIVMPGCLHAMEKELEETISKARTVARDNGSDVVMTGILPTLSMSDLTLENMTDGPRYRELNRMLNELRGGTFYIHIKGLDEIQFAHDNMMAEACNTSFQIHYQVDPNDFADMYNLAQVVTAPILAAAVNSPLLFGKKLWSETRLAVFQHSVDERSQVQQTRSRPTRVTFGEHWVEKSVIEVFREDIARFRVILTHSLADEDPFQILSRGEIPSLNALKLHNGTVWRWNRPCYGITNGKPHLRIENRALPSGPSIVDEVANMAFFLGLMSSLKEEYGPIQKVLAFDSAKFNFWAAARHGLDAQFHWVNGSTHSAKALILGHLLPLAHAGLELAGIPRIEANYYLSIIEERVRSAQTGSQWMINSFTSMGNEGTVELRCRTLTSAMLKAQQEGEPVHKWAHPKMNELENFEKTYQTVSQFMSTDLFTVRPDDIADYVASLMHWEHIRHVPVEDAEGKLVGLVSQRNLLLLLTQGSSLNRAQGVPVHMIMKRDLITVPPDASTLEAVKLMRKNKIGCLPVVKDEKIIGIVTLFDILNLSGKLLESALDKNHSVNQK